jgi:hypothetical protein
MTTTTPTSGVSPRTLPRSPTGSPDSGFVLTLWTADPAVARTADAAGVDRIGVDLERLGKAVRQNGLGTWISPHTRDDLAAIRAVVKRARLFARLNPPHSGTPAENEAVLELGAEVLMLPMVADPADVERVVSLAAGRAAIVLLLERREALERVQELISVPGIEEAHLGLNDLALSLGLGNRWLVLAGDIPFELGVRMRDAGIRFGLGGIGRPDDHGLPMPPELVYAECARTGATAALLSRSFARAGDLERLAGDVDRARAALAAWQGADRRSLEEAHDDLGRRARLLPSW